MSEAVEYGVSGRILFVDNDIHTRKMMELALLICFK